MKSKRALSFKKGIVIKETENKVKEITKKTKWDDKYNEEYKNFLHPIVD